MIDDPDQELRVVALQAAAQGDVDEAGVLTRANQYWHFLRHGHPLPDAGDLHKTTYAILNRHAGVTLDELNQLVMAAYAHKPDAVRGCGARLARHNGYDDLVCALGEDHAPIQMTTGRYDHVDRDGVVFQAGQG